MEFKDEIERQTWLYNMGWKLHQHEPEILNAILDMKSLPESIRKPLEQGRDRFEKDRYFLQKKLEKRQRLDKLKQLWEHSHEQDKEDDLER